MTLYRNPSQVAHGAPTARKPWSSYRTDQEAEYDAYYGDGYPEKFAPSVVAGTRVTPAFASPCEGKVEGRVVRVTMDRAFAVVLWESGEESRVEPWDVYADEPEAGR